MCYIYNFLRNINLKACLYLCFFIAYNGSAQISEGTEFKTNAESFKIDQLGNFYFISENSVTKADFNLKKIAIYDAKQFGNITDIDISNPFKTLIYHKDFNTLVFLDNYLAELRSPILIDNLNFYDIDQICYSYIGSFRIFDNQNCRTILFDKDLKVIQNGLNLYSIINKQEIKKMRESSNYIFLLFESGQGILLDKFGNFYKEIALENIQDFEFNNDQLFLLIDNNIIIYDSKTSETSTIFSLESSSKIRDFAIYENNIYYLINKSIKINKIQH